MVPYYHNPEAHIQISAVGQLPGNTSKTLLSFRMQVPAICRKFWPTDDFERGDEADPLLITNRNSEVSLAPEISSRHSRYGNQGEKSYGLSTALGKISDTSNSWYWWNVPCVLELLFMLYMHQQI